MAENNPGGKSPRQRIRVHDPRKEGGRPPINREQARIQQMLKQMRFQRTVVGGVSEADVWKKIARLNALYEVALEAERARYDALLQEKTGQSPDYSEAGDRSGE